jgi:transcriptional antiterminator RfaH
MFHGEVPLGSMRVHRYQSAAAWMAVSTHPHREHFALENLERQGFIVYCPVVRRRRSHARRMDVVKRPLFPGYLFVNIKTKPASWRLILSTYGVRNLVRCGDQPCLLDASFIEALQAREVDGAIVRPAVPYQVGQQVQITAGGFDGVVGTILALDEKDRITVLLDLMNRPIKTRLEGTQILPL